MEIIIFLVIGLIIKALFGVGGWWKSLDAPKVKLYFSWDTEHKYDGEGKYDRK